MSNYNKSIGVRNWFNTKYLTRKDYRAKARFYGSHGIFRTMKHNTNVRIRNYKGDMQDGGWYKRFDDPWCYD